MELWFGTMGNCRRDEKIFHSPDENRFFEIPRDDTEAAGFDKQDEGGVGNRSLLDALTVKGTVSNEGRPSKST